MAWAPVVFAESGASGEGEVNAAQTAHVAGADVGADANG